MTDRNRPSRAALKEWLKVPGRTQAQLAKAASVTQQHISAVLKDRTPTEELARLIDAATLGDVSWAGWFTVRELARFEKKLEKARRLGARLANRERRGGQHVSLGRPLAAP